MNKKALIVVVRRVGTDVKRFRCERWIPLFAKKLQRLQLQLKQQRRLRLTFCPLTWKATMHSYCKVDPKHYHTSNTWNLSTIGKGPGPKFPWTRPFTVSVRQGLPVIGMGHTVICGASRIVGWIITMSTFGPMSRVSMFTTTKSWYNAWNKSFNIPFVKAVRFSTTINAPARRTEDNSKKLNHISCRLDQHIDGPWLTALTGL
mmetsp:Transcript_33989/g.81683  ORF Transcript_33989/g.81683 Transcript_33989/m.81683 type:complete len:203 (+) Transcript_33989:808-1416(+)